MQHGGMRSGLLHATRSLSDLAQIPKEDIQTLEQLWLALNMSQCHLCQAKDTRLDPDFGKNGCVLGGECSMVGCVVGCCMPPEASLTWPRYLRKISKHLNSCGWPSTCHNVTFARPRTPGWTLILAKMGAFLAVNAAWWEE